MSRASVSIRAIPALLRIGFAESVAYRAEFLVWILSTTMRYTNRPSGIQQVISFNGHR